MRVSGLAAVTCEHWCAANVPRIPSAFASGSSCEVQARRQVMRMLKMLILKLLGTSSQHNHVQYHTGVCVEALLHSTTFWYPTRQRGSQ